MMNEARDNVVMMRRFKSKAEAEAMRERNLQHFCYWLIDAFKQAD